MANQIYIWLGISSQQASRADLVSACLQYYALTKDERLTGARDYGDIRREITLDASKK